MIGTLSQEMRLSLGMLSAALVLGILGDGLLRATPWGINVPIWIVLLLAVTFGLAAWRGIGLTGGGRWLVAPALFFASIFAWRASPALWFFNILALAAALALGITRLRSGRLVIAGVGDYIVAGVMAALHAIGGVLALVTIDVKWDELPRGRWFALGVSVGCGLLIALPLLLVFGVLFAAADPVFERIVSDLLNWDVSTILSHLLLTSFIA
ncbi:MAG: hypothetical protein HY329_22680, partial [Chloroflexi bacterium]|nr:hypothetical protein [Chloroflexota bacterium]